jgi:hypothetical protein
MESFIFSKGRRSQPNQKPTVRHAKIQFKSADVELCGRTFCVRWKKFCDLLRQL